MSLSKYDFLLHQKMFKFAKHMRTTFPYAPCSNLRVGSNTSNPVVLVLCNTWIEMQISSRKWLNTHNRAPYVIPLQLHEDWTIRKKKILLDVFQIWFCRVALCVIVSLTAAYCVSPYLHCQWYYRTVFQRCSEMPSTLSLSLCQKECNSLATGWSWHTLTHFFFSLCLYLWLQSVRCHSCLSVSVSLVQNNRVFFLFFAFSHSNLFYFQR